MTNFNEFEDTTAAPSVEDTQTPDATGQTSEVQSNRRRKTVIAIVAAAALVLAGSITGSVVYANHVQERQRLRLRQRRRARTHAVAARTRIPARMARSPRQAAPPAEARKRPEAVSHSQRRRQLRRARVKRY